METTRPVTLPQKIMELLAPLNARPEHELTQVHFRVDEEGQRITFLVENSSAQLLLEALDYVHSLADELPAPFSMVIAGTLSLRVAPVPRKRHGLRSHVTRAIAWVRR